MMTTITDTLRLISRYKAKLTYQQFKTLIGQAKSGDTEGAKKGLYRLLERGQKMAIPKYNAYIMTVANEAIFLDGQLTNCNPPFIQALSPDYKYLIYYDKDLEHWCMKTEPTLKKE